MESTIPASADFAIPRNKTSNTTHQSPAVSPMITPHIMATNEIQGPVSPLSIYDDMAAKHGVLDGGSSPVEATRDTAVAVDASSDDSSQVPLARDDPPVLNDPIADLEVSRDSPGPKDGTYEDPKAVTEEDYKDATKQDDKPANEDLLDPGFPNHRAATAASDSGAQMSPDSEPGSSSVKSKPSKRRMKITIDPSDLPSPDDELTDAQIASLCSQPPRIRQNYTKYFASSGVIRATHSKVLLERLPDGELRFPEEILRSCLPKWKGRLEASELGESTQPGVGHSRKRKGTVTPAKRGADGEIDSAKKTKKPSASKREELLADPGGTDHNSQSLPRPTIRIRPVITPRTALSMGPPPSTILSQPSTALQAGSSEPLTRNPLKGSAVPTVDQNQHIHSDASEGQSSNPSAAPNMDNRRSFLGRHPGQATRVFNAGSCQLLDPNYLSQFAQYLTGEIQQLDIAIVGIAHGAQHQSRRYSFRHLRDILVELRDLCVDVELELRSRMVTKSQDEMDDF